MVEPNNHISNIIQNPPESQPNITLYASISPNTSRTLACRNVKGFRKIVSGQREGKVLHKCN